MEKIAVLCDMHLSCDKNAPQYAFLSRASQQMHLDGIQKIIVCGDITAYGDVNAYRLYRELLQDFEVHEVLGNSDVRDAATAQQMSALVAPDEFFLEGRRIMGIQTPYSVIPPSERERMQALSNGDVLFLHHYTDSLEQESREYLLSVLQSKAITVLHGHGHRIFDYAVGNSHVYGFRGLDPDKAIGAPPCINYLTVSPDGIENEEIRFPLAKETFLQAKGYFGISCVDLVEDMTYAAEHGIAYAELRCDHAPWPPEPSLLRAVEAWRSRTHGFLSVHLPNLKYKEGEICGIDKWNSVLEYALLLGADHLTLHPPRVSRGKLVNDPALWERFLELFTAVAQRVSDKVSIGVENMHREKCEPYDEGEGFAYIPSEVALWIDAINRKLGRPQRVGHVLDVGHARNNGKHAERYPISRWYGIMGGRAVAYHIHQSVRKDGNNLKNHCPLSNWFGPMINYTGFFHAWETGVLNHAPIFLEVNGAKNHEESMRGFEMLLQDY